MIYYCVTDMYFEMHVITKLPTEFAVIFFNLFGVTQQFHNNVTDSLCIT